MQLTGRYRAAHRVIVGVRTLADLMTFDELRADLRRLGFIESAADIAPFAAAGVDIIRLWPEWTRCGPDLVAKVHGLGQGVWVTAGDAPLDEMERLIDLGVDGIPSDSPVRLKALASPTTH